MATLHLECDPFVCNQEKQVAIWRGVFGQRACVAKTSKYLKREERVVACLLQHPNIIKYYGCFKVGKLDALVFEQGNMDALHWLKRFGKMNKQHTHHYMAALISALTYLHNVAGIAHRDVSLENLVMFCIGDVQDGFHQLKLIDFEDAVGRHPVHGFQRNEFIYAPFGKMRTTAPEVYASEPYDAQQVDVWAAGVILFAFVTALYPYEVPKGEHVEALAKGDMAAYRRIMERSVAENDESALADLDPVFDPAFVSMFRDRTLVGVTDLLVKCAYVPPDPLQANPLQ